MVSISRMWVLQSKGQDCRKRSLTPKTRVRCSLEDFLSEKKVQLKPKVDVEDKRPKADMENSLDQQKSKPIEKADEREILQYGMNFNQAEPLRAHRITHSDVRKFACNDCVSKFRRKHHLRMHKFKQHNQEKKEVKQREKEEKDQNKVCELCQKTCTSARSFRDHMNTHSPDYSCKRCGKTFTTTRSLINHVNIVHEGVRKHICNSCGKSFGRITNLKDHMSRIHKINIDGTDHNQEQTKKINLKKEEKQREKEEKDQNRVCEQCVKKCPSARSLRVHMNTHSQDHSCKVCGKTFTLKKYLNDHINIVHERVKKHLCKLCGKSFGRSTNLHDHSMRMHRTDTN